MATLIEHLAETKAALAETWRDKNDGKLDAFAAAWPEMEGDALLMARDAMRAEQPDAAPDAQGVAGACGRRANGVQRILGGRNS